MPSIRQFISQEKKNSEKSGNEFVLLKSKRLIKKLLCV
jgi:hypothetical protein